MKKAVLVLVSVLALGIGAIAVNFGGDPPVCPPPPFPCTQAR